MLDLIASYLVRVINIALYFMPIGLNLWFARLIGRVFYFFSGKRGRITYANLKAAYSGEKTPEELKHITKDVYINAAQTFIEILSLTKVDPRYVDKYVTVHDLERIREASKNPGGMILLSAHYGNWELSIATSVIKGFPLYILARDQKMKRLNELLNSLRELKGNFVIRKGLDVKNIFRILKEGKSLGILADQNAGASGLLLDFFGRPASTATGPYRFAQKTGAVILPAFIRRKKGPYHDLFLEEPMVIEKNEDIKECMARYNKLLEKYISETPSQWFWMHKKWKLTPVKKIMVLNDGKKGHLKQALSIAKQARKYRSDKGFLPEHTITDVVDINFRNSVTKNIIKILSPLFSKRSQGSMRCLKWALTPESYRKAVMNYADIILSCGSGMAPVNILLKYENNARNVSVMGAAPFMVGKFDLMVIPRHDIKKAEGTAENTVVTDLAPNMIDEETIKEYGSGNAGKRDRTDPNDNGTKPCIGLLVGGDNPLFYFDDELMKDLLNAVNETCARTGSSVYGTTSRRTPVFIKPLIKGVLGSSGIIYDIVFADEDNDEHTVEKILSMSSILIVSGESISMVSEAVSSGKKVLVFMPKKRRKARNKYEKFVDDLCSRGFVNKIVPTDIPSMAEKMIKTKREECKRLVPEDDRKIYDKMYKLF